uniref:Uncharacterized protein n=1 Tax=Fagus sylvatica TaxID=28930 RepID=A0A2N9J793_FAGSY
MVIETRGGVPIGVLKENVQELQQQIDENANSLRLINARDAKMELSIAAMKALVEERLPPRHQTTMVQPEPQREAQSGQGGGAPIVELNHEVQTMVQPEPQREAQSSQGGGAPIVGNQPSILKTIEPIPRRAETRNVIPMRASNHEQAQPQRHASQAREPRNAPWPQDDVVETWYDHGGGKGNCGRARNYQGPQDRDPLWTESRSTPKATRKVAVQIAPKVAAQFDPKVAAQLDPKVAVQFDPKVAAQLNPKVAAQMDPKVVDPKPISARPTMMVQKLTPKQMLERRRKGLCYYCDESWTMWHTCKTMKLYLIKKTPRRRASTRSFKFLQDIG